MNIRELTSLAEFKSCLQLQQEGFGWADIDLMPVRLFVVTRHIGGLVLGAYRDNTLVAFLSTLPGIRGNKPYWHSHMLAVSKACRGSGIGTALKLAQRQHARRRGISLVEWTFDPLESRNAYLNIAKLGVIVRHYYPDLYGQTSAPGQHGIASDRLLAEWWLDETAPGSAQVERRVTIPSDILSLKQSDLAQVRDLQLRVRAEFQKNLQEDFYVSGFERRGDTCDYLFTRGASRVHPVD